MAEEIPEKKGARATIRYKPLGAVHEWEKFRHELTIPCSMTDSCQSIADYFKKEHVIGQGWQVEFCGVVIIPDE
jgi:hypothetical protein